MRINLLKLFVNEYRKRRKKTSLITFAIAWGALSLLLMMAFGRGMSNQFNISFQGLGIDLVMFTGGRTSKIYQGLPKGRRIRLYREDVDLIRKKIPHVKTICAESYVEGLISYKGHEANRTLHGVEPLHADLRSFIAQPGGRFINPDDDRYSRRVVFVGWNLASELFGDEPPVGKTIEINRTPFLVIGVMKRKLQSGNYQGLDYDHVFVPLSTLAQVNSQQYIDRLHVQPLHRSLSLKLEEEVKKLLGKKYRFDPEDEYAINIWNTIEDGNVSVKVFKGIEIFLGIMGALTLLIAAVGVTNLMYAVVKERTREIGVKMAMGSKRRHIVLQFLLEALLIFVKGTFWGGLIAYNIVSLIRKIPVQYSLTSVSSYLLRPVFATDILLAFIAIMGLLIFFSGIFPALKASKLNPVDALRYE